MNHFLCICLMACAAATAAESKAPPASPAFGPLILDDAPQPMAQQPRTEAQRDRLEALARFAAGRMHQRREEYAEALRCYERALRYDPQSSAIAGAIVPVAVRLNRYSEAVSYALKAEEVDPLLLCRLGDYLNKEGDWAQAVTFYEKALVARDKGKETAADILLRMEVGRLYYLTDKYKQAAESLARVVYAIDHPDEFALDEQLKKVLLGEPGPTYQLIGECFLGAERPQEALTVFQKAEQLAPNKALRQFNLARVYAKTGKPAEALSALEACFAERLTDQGTVPYQILADVLASLGKKDQLLDRLERLRTAEPNNEPLAYYLAAQYRAADKLDKAESLYLGLLKGNATLTGCRSLVDMYRQSKRFDALLAVMGEALEKMSVLEVLGAEAQTISGDADSMRRLVETARSAMKSDPAKFGYGMRLAVASLALEAKQYETAGEFFNLALAVKNPGDKSLSQHVVQPPPAVQAPPTQPKAAVPQAGVGPSSEPSRAAEVLMVWGVGLLIADHAAEAVKVFQRGIDEKALPDDNPAFYFYLAGALAMAERPDEALIAARTAADKKKDSARFRGRAAWVLYTAKRYDEAIAAYRELIREFDADHVSTETRDVLRAARLALSNLAVIKRDMPQAEEWLEQVLDEFPDDEGALNDLGYLWADQNKNLQRADRMIRKAVETEPDNRAYRDSLGWVLFRLEKYPEAVAELEKAAAGEKPDGVVLDHLGDAYLRVNRREKAVETWRKAVEVLRREKEAEKAEAVEKKTQNK